MCVRDPWLLVIIQTDSPPVAVIQYVPNAVVRAFLILWSPPPGPRHTLSRRYLTQPSRESKCTNPLVHWHPGILATSLVP